MKLTQKTVETAIYEGRSFMSKSGRKRWSQHVLWDDGLPGFGLRITPTNRKSFIVAYRSGGRKRTKSLGAAGKLKLHEARRRAAELLASLDEQPRETHQPPIEGVTTVAQLADAYLEQHLKRNVPSWYADQRLMQTHIKPAMGRALIREVTQTDLANIRGRVAKRFPADARRLATLLAGMFDWAAGHGLWSKSSRRADAATAAPQEAPSDEPAPAAEPEPERAATAAELQERLDRTEAERRELAARLDEVSASGVEMVEKLGEQTAELKKLERELALARRELERARSAGADRPVHEQTEKQMANLRQSVDQLMASLREARSERGEMAEKLARVEGRDGARSRKSAELMRRRNELEAELLEKERRIAILRSERRAGSRRVALWLGAAALGGALLFFVASRAFAPRPAGAPAAAQRPAAGATSAAAAPPPSAPAAAAPLRPAATAADREPAAGGAGSPAGTAPTATGPDLAAVEPAVRSWAAAWSEQRVDDYLSAYSERFAPADGLARSAWAAQRRSRILRPASIRVTLGELRRTALADDRVRVEFEQVYETESYTDTVRKTLELVWEDGGWKIAAERAP